MKTLPALVLALSIAGYASAKDAQYDVQYAAPDGIPQLMDYRIPDGPGPFPALIFVHGGGWSGGDKESPTEVVPILDPLYNGNIAWFTINYRLSRVAKYPACVEDVESAVQYVKAHAKELNIDPNKIAIGGESAGGHIVDMVAVRATPDKPERHLAAVVSYYDPNDLVEDSFRRNTASPSLQGLFGISGNVLNTETVKILQNASPTAYISPNLPPFLLLHGTADQSVDYPGSFVWQEALGALGVPCELITIPMGIHVMGNWDRMDPPQVAYKDQMVAWLHKTFNNPPPPVVKADPVTKDYVYGLWKNIHAPDNSGIYLADGGVGDSLLAPTCSVKWTFDPATNLVHVDYPDGQGRDAPYAGSPDLPQSAKDKITNAGVRPKISFYDLRYFPVQDVIIASDGGIYTRQTEAATNAYLAKKAAAPPAKP